MKDIVVGIDVGGTNTKVGLVDRDGRCLAESTVKTTEYPNARDFVKAVSAQIDRMLQSAGKDLHLAGIGIGAPNGNFYRGTIEHAPNLQWRGIIPLAEMFKEIY
jgi:glucokinase